MKSTRRVDAASETPVQHRSDWYAFFHCSDLVGRKHRQKCIGRQTGRTAHCRKQHLCRQGPDPSRRPGVRLTVS